MCTYTDAVSCVFRLHLCLFCVSSSVYCLLCFSSSFVFIICVFRLCLMIVSFVYAYRPCFSCLLIVLVSFVSCLSFVSFDSCLSSVFRLCLSSVFRLHLPTASFVLIYRPYLSIRHRYLSPPPITSASFLLLANPPLSLEFLGSYPRRSSHEGPHTSVILRETDPAAPRSLSTAPRG